MLRLTPDRIIRPSLELRERYRSEQARGVRGLSADVRKVALNLSGVKIYDVHDIGKGDVYIVSTVVDGVSPEPVVVELKTFKGIADGEDLPLVPPGVALYRTSDAIPPFIDWRLLIAESDSGIRETGELLGTLSKDDDWKTISAALKTILATGNPALTAVLGIVDSLLAVVGRVLKLNEDDQIAYMPVTYDRDLDNLGIGSHKARVKDAFVKWDIRSA